MDRIDKNAVYHLVEMKHRQVSEFNVEKIAAAKMWVIIDIQLLHRPHKSSRHHFIVYFD